MKIADQTYICTDDRTVLQPFSPNSKPGTLFSILDTRYCMNITFASLQSVMLVKVDLNYRNHCPFQSHEN
jgi:hypothetical protein